MPGMPPGGILPPGTRVPPGAVLPPGISLPPNGKIIGGFVMVPPYAGIPDGANKTEYVTIWPHYLNGNLSPEQGRRVTKKHAPAEPSVQEIFIVCSKTLKFRDVYVHPMKMYPRSQSQLYCVPPVAGCVYVNIDSAPEGSDIISKGALLREIGDAINKMADRKTETFAQDQFNRVVEQTERIMLHKAKDKSRRKGRVQVVRR